MRSKALITGITGQDGSYLAEFLLEKGYQVHGLIRRSSSFNTGRIDHLYRDPHDPETKLFLHFGDLSDALSLERVMHEVEPDEVYNLGAQSHVGVSFIEPAYTSDVVALGALRLLEIIRDSFPKTRFYQASSSEMFGNSPENPQREDTPFCPQSPYAAAKHYAYTMTKLYRESYSLHASNGILFNHESPRRGRTFVTRKITEGLARIVLGQSDTLYLGNLNAERDWGFAGDYVEAMWAMVQQDEPGDYVVATGKSLTVRSFLERCMSYLNIPFVHNGAQGAGEQYHNKETGKLIVAIDERYFRPAEVHALRGDPEKANKRLGWQPKTTIDELIAMMIESDLMWLKGKRIGAIW